MPGSVRGHPKRFRSFRRHLQKIVADQSDHSRNRVRGLNFGIGIESRSGWHLALMDRSNFAAEFLRTVTIRLHTWFLVSESHPAFFRYRGRERPRPQSCITIYLFGRPPVRIPPAQQPAKGSQTAAKAEIRVAKTGILAEDTPIEARCACHLPIIPFVNQYS